MYTCCIISVHSIRVFCTLGIVWFVVCSIRVNRYTCILPCIFSYHCCYCCLCYNYPLNIPKRCRNPVLPENLYACKCSKVTWLPQHQLIVFLYTYLYVTFILLVVMTYPELCQWLVGVWHQILQAYITSVLAICMIFVQTYCIFKTSYSKQAVSW